MKEGSNHTKISLSETDVEITVQLRQNSPARGTVTVNLLERADGFYEGELVEYIYPPVQVGQTHDARVYESRNKAKIEFDSRDVRVAMRDDIYTTGEASIKIVDISDAIYGRLDTDITPLSGREEKTSDIDITDVSKF